MGFYNITIYDMSESAIIHVGPLNYTQTNESEQNLITEEFMSELLVDEQYIVEIVVDSIGVKRVIRTKFNITNSKLHRLYKASGHGIVIYKI